MLKKDSFIRIQNRLMFNIVTMVHIVLLLYISCLFLLFDVSVIKPNSFLVPIISFLSFRSIFILTRQFFRIKYFSFTREWIISLDFFNLVCASMIIINVRGIIRDSPVGVTFFITAHSLMLMSFITIAMSYIMQHFFYRFFPWIPRTWSVQNYGITPNESFEDHCALCGKCFGAGDKVWLTECKHKFHFSCIKDSLKISNTCKTCKQVLYQKVKHIYKCEGLVESF